LKGIDDGSSRILQRKKKIESDEESENWKVDGDDGEEM